MCVSSPLEALQLLDRGLVANLFLIHAGANKAKDSLFAPALLQNISSEKLCILSDPGDTSWNDHAERWKINTVLTMPLLERAVEKLTTRPSVETTALASPTINPSGKIPHYHLENLYNNRLFMEASPAMMERSRRIRVLAP